MHTLEAAADNFAAMTAGGGTPASSTISPFGILFSTGDRIMKGLVDTTTRSGYALLGAKPKTPHEAASEYHQFDWEYSQTPEQSSWLASSWVMYLFYISQSRLLFRRVTTKNPTRSQIVLV
jgi:hypothetical protein